MLHVLFVSSWFPSISGNINGSFNLTWVKCMQNYVKLSVITVDYDFNGSKTLITKENLSNNGCIYCVIIPKNIPKWKQWALKYKNISQLISKIYVEHPFHIIHNSVVWNLGIIAYLKALKFKTPFIVTEHNTDYITQKSVWYTRLISYFILKKACLVTVVGDSLLTKFISKGIKNGVVIPNFINPEIQNYTINGALPYNFIHVTNFDFERKGTLQVINAFINLKFGNNATLTIIADKVDVLKTGYNLSQLQTLGIKWISTFKDVNLYYKELAKNHCYISFSTSETYGLSIVESLNIGLFCIFTACGGPENYMQPNWGTLVKSTKDLSKAMQNAMQQNSTNLLNLPKINATFNNEKVAKLYINEYAKVKRRI